MVGVPHSTGCSLCRERRIKCDEAVPECKQCRKYGRKCPGYQRAFRFQDETPALERRRHSTSKARRKTVRAEGSGKRNKSPRSTGAARDNAIALMRRHSSGVSLDEDVSPSLVRKSFMSQQPQLFGDFVRAAFPTMYFHNRFRAGDRLDFVTHMIETFGSHSYQDASTCCLSSVYLAHLTKDPALLKASRQLYGLALREVLHALSTPEGTSENMMCTMMMLSVYEMYARTSKDAWVMHADGVKRVMQVRGAKAYESGFSRSLYIAFRGFLIATALYEGKHCFLEGDEWQRFASKIRSEDSKKPGEWSAFVDISELAFMEMAKCPGYISEAKAVNDSTPQTAIHDLVDRMQGTSRRLVGITTELTSCISAHSQRQQGIVYRPGSFVGPVPKVFPETSPSFLLRGAESTIDMLNRLAGQLTEITESRVVEIPTLSSDSSANTASSPETADASSPETPKTFSLPFRVVSELGRGPSNTSDKNDPRAVTWLDRVASSMGMLGTEVIQSDSAARRDTSPAIEEVYDD